jgi:hypothetical protein
MGCLLRGVKRTFFMQLNMSSNDPTADIILGIFKSQLGTTGRASFSFAPPHDLVRFATREPPGELWQHHFHCLHAG